MKNILAALLVLSAFALQAQNTIVPWGSFITWQALDSVNYEITLTVYSECVNPPASQTVRIVSAIDTGFDAELNFISKKDVTNIGSKCTDKSACQGGAYKYSFEELIYKGNINTAPLAACDIEVQWQGPARPASITTGAAGLNHFNSATFNRCEGKFNSSPLYAYKPNFILATGQDMVCSYAAHDTVDADDSFSMELVRVRQANGSYTSYSGNYHYRAPINFLGFPGYWLSTPAGFHADSVTCQIAFRPTLNKQVTVYGIGITEWRKVGGVRKKIGVTYFDLMWGVDVSPNNNLPTLTGVTMKEFCAGQTTCMMFGSQDPNSADTVSLTLVSSDIKNGTFTITNPTAKRQTASYCWTPTDADIRAKPYYLTVMAEDNVCPVPGRASRTFAISVRPLADSSYFSIQKQDTCKRLFVDYTLNKPFGFSTSTSWVVLPDGLSSGDKNRVFSLQTPGKKEIILTVRTSNSCALTLKDSIETKFPVAGFATDKDSGLAPLDVSFIPSDSTAADYLWEFGTGDTSTAQRPVYTYLSPGYYSVALTLSDGTCKDSVKTDSAIYIKNKPTSIQSAGTEIVSIYPNPANGFLNIKSPEIINTIIIYDISGKTVMRKEMNSNRADIDVSGLAEGVYVVKGELASGGTVQEKLLIKR